jgi:thiol-disulfide isomerase/thioredoxin
MEYLPLILIAIIIILGISIMVVCHKKYKSENFNTDRSKFGDIGSGDTTAKVYIFYAPWCGFCKESMDKFNDAVIRGNGQIVLVDATDDANKALVDKYGISGFPTIIKESGIKYSGDRSADSILAFARS